MSSQFTPVAKSPKSNKRECQILQQISPNPLVLTNNSKHNTPLVKPPISFRSFTKSYNYTKSDLNMTNHKENFYELTPKPNPERVPMLGKRNLSALTPYNVNHRTDNKRLKVECGKFCEIDQKVSDKNFESKIFAKKKSVKKIFRAKPMPNFSKNQSFH